MAKPYNTKILTPKNIRSKSNCRFSSNVGVVKVNDFVRRRKISYGSSKVIDERDMRFWKEFDYFPGILIGVMRRWENGNR